MPSQSKMLKLTLAGGLQFAQGKSYSFLKFVPPAAQANVKLPANSAAQTDNKPKTKKQNDDLANVNAEYINPDAPENMATRIMAKMNAKLAAHKQEDRALLKDKENETQQLKDETFKTIKELAYVAYVNEMRGLLKQIEELKKENKMLTNGKDKMLNLIGLLNDENSAKENAMLGLQMQIVELKAASSVFNTEKKELNQKNADLASENGILRNTLSRLDGNLAEKDKEIEELKSKLAEKETEIAKHKSALAEQDKAHQEALMNQNQEANAALTKALAEQDKAHQEALMNQNQEANAAKRSKSSVISNVGSSIHSTITKSRARFAVASTFNRGLTGCGRIFTRK